MGVRMKNKLYYILFVFYCIGVAFILYINGVFTGEVSSYTNLMINGAFLFIIGVLFVISAFSFSRLNRCTAELQTVTEQGNARRPFVPRRDFERDGFRRERNDFSRPRNDERRDYSRPENAEGEERRTPHTRVEIDPSVAATIFIGIGRNRRVFPREIGRASCRERV